MSRASHARVSPSSMRYDSEMSLSVLHTLALPAAPASPPIIQLAEEVLVPSSAVELGKAERPVVTRTAWVSCCWMLNAPNRCDAAT